MDEGSKEGYNHGLIPTPWESVCLHDDGPLRAVSGHGGVLWWGLSHLCHSLALVMWVHELTPPLYLALHISFPFLSPELNTINTLLVPTSPRGYEPSACDRIVSHRCAQLSRVLRTQRRDKQRAMSPSASPPENPREPRVVPTPSAHRFSDQRASALLSSDKRLEILFKTRYCQATTRSREQKSLYDFNEDCR